jgi:hypothetical protein
MHVLVTRQRVLSASKFFNSASLPHRPVGCVNSDISSLCSSPAQQFIVSFIGISQMVQIQLGVAICLAISVAFSSFLLYLNQTKDGKVALPTHDEGDDHDRADDQESETISRRDPFDVVKPDDLSEGQPIDEHAFWARVRFSLPY